MTNKSDAEEFVPTGVLAAAAAHYDRMRGQTIEVPEWGDENGPLIVHYDPITSARSQTIQRRAGDSDARMTAFTVILYAKDKDGNRIFPDDKGTLTYFLTKVDPRVQTRIAKAILGEQERKDAPDLGE